MRRALLIVLLVVFILPPVVVIVLYSGYRVLNSMHTTNVLKDEGCQDSTINPLESAMYDGNPRKLRALLEKGADPNEEINCQGQTPLFTVLFVAESYRPDIIVNDNPFDLLSLLIQYGADLNHVDKLGMTPLNRLIISFPREKRDLELELGTVLINAGADPYLAPEYPCFWIFDCSRPTPYENALMHGKFALASAIRARPGHVDPDNFASLVAAGKRELMIDRILASGDDQETMRLGLELFWKDSPEELLAEKDREKYLKELVEAYP